MWFVFASLVAVSTMVKEARAQGSLFPTGSSEAWLAELYEPAKAYSMQGVAEDPSQQDPLRVTRSLDRDENAQFHPFSASHNIEWIENYRRSGAVRFYHPYLHGALPTDIPSYQVYSRQQHHGRLGGIGNFGAIASPTGFGHGGFQNSFAQSRIDDPGHRSPNFQLGPLTGNITALGTAEWIDRLPTTIAPDGSPAADDGLLLLSTGIDMSAQVQITERGILEFQIGAGIDYYPDGRPGNDGFEEDHVEFQVLPNTFATYTFTVGDAEFSIYDRFARFRNRAFSYYSLDPLDYADYQEHALGTVVTYPLNDRLTAETGYEFGQLDSLGTGGEFLDRTTHNYFGGLTYSPDDTWEIGLQGSASTFDYDLPERPDGDSATAGLFGRLPISDYTRLSATAGYHQFDFESAGGTSESDSLDSFYWSFAIENDLNDRLTHGVTAGSGAALGVSSNYVETAHVGYNARLRIFDSTLITGRVHFLNSDESGGELAEDTDSIQYHLGIQHDLTEHTTLGVNVTYYDTLSDLADRDYSQTRIQAYCSVEINDRLELHASIQTWDVDSDDPGGSFTQNSASIGFTYYF